MFDAYFFDLDGTLVDTAPDLGGALNRLLIEEGRSARPAEDLRPVVSHGAMGLLKRGFDMDPEHPNYDHLRHRLLEIYEQHLADESCLFPGMATVLDELDQQSLPWGIITNKPEYLAQPLCESLELASRAHCLIGGTTQTQAKPDPERLNMALEQCGLDPETCCYVGDDRRDMQAAAQAGMVGIAAHYGYIMEDDDPWQWPAHHHIQSPDDLLSILKNSLTAE